MTTFSKLAVTFVAVVALALSVFAFRNSLFGASSGPDHWNQENFYNGIVVGSPTSGTSLSKYLCVTGTWNPGSVASSGAVAAGTNTTSTVLSSAGSFVVNKPISVKLDSATNTTNVIFWGNAFTTGSTTVGFTNFDTAVIDFATGTVRACQWQ